jgi:hypothetical protein
MTRKASPQNQVAQYPNHFNHGSSMPRNTSTYFPRTVPISKTTFFSPILLPILLLQEPAAVNLPSVVTMQKRQTRYFSYLFLLRPLPHSPPAHSHA